MVPLERMKLGYLVPGDFLILHCDACGRVAHIRPAELIRRPGISLETLIVDLPPRFRCDNCNTLGRVSIAVELDELRGKRGDRTGRG
jgi:hypothetical protein